MIGWVFWKVLGDVCLYFSAVSAIPALFPHTMSFLVPVLLWAVASAAAAELAWQGKTKWSRWCGILPFLSLLLARSVMEFLILIPALGYCIAVIFRGDFHLEYYDFRARFLKLLGIWCCGFLIVSVFHGLEASAGGNAVLATEEPLCYGLAWILSSLLLCRMLRMGLAARKKPLTGKQAAAVLTASGAAVVCAVGIERFLQDQAMSLLKLLSGLPAILLGVPGQIIGWLVNWVLSLVDKDYVEYFETKEQEILEMTATEVPPTEEVLEQVSRSPGFPWWLALLVLSTLAVLLAYMLKQLRTETPTAVTAESREKMQQPKEKERKSRRSNRSMVRKYYRSFLKTEKKKGMRLHPGKTSEDILREVSADTDRNAAGELRQVYLAARYDLTREITRQQVETAKDALRRTRAVE